MARRASFELAGQSVPPGRRATVNLPMTALPDHTPLTLSVHVVHGARQGPTMFVSGAIHGDEVIGPEIVCRLLRAQALGGMAGTLLAVPIVNSFGFLNGSRYPPDRRDLNRSFPGPARGSLAARLASPSAPRWWSVARRGSTCTQPPCTAPTRPRSASRPASPRPCGWRRPLPRR